MEPNFQGLVQGQTRPRSRLMARPGLWLEEEDWTALLFCREVSGRNSKPSC